jgi:hypothetical protein
MPGARRQGRAARRAHPPVRRQRAGAQASIAHATGLGALFGDLRHQLQTQYSPDLPKLPLTTITFGLPSFRPPDDLIMAATGFSGIPAFIELVDTDAAARLEDPLKTRLQELVR